MIVVYRCFTVGLIVVLMDGKYEMIQRCGIGDEVTAGDGGQEMGVKKSEREYKDKRSAYFIRIFSAFYYVCFFLFSLFFFLLPDEESIPCSSQLSKRLHSHDE